MKLTFLYIFSYFIKKKNLKKKKMLIKNDFFILLVFAQSIYSLKITH